MEEGETYEWCNASTISANSALEMTLDEPASINQPDILHLNLILCKDVTERTHTDFYHYWSERANMRHFKRRTSLKISTPINKLSQARFLQYTVITIRHRIIIDFWLWILAAAESANNSAAEIAEKMTHPGKTPQFAL